MGQDQASQEIRPLFTQGLKAQARATEVISWRGEQEAADQGTLLDHALGCGEQHTSQATKTATHSSGLPSCPE